MLTSGLALIIAAGLQGLTAQQVQSPPPTRGEVAQDAEGAVGVDDVVVTARRTEVRSSIDAVSYDVTRNLVSQSGTLADVLRAVPSVDVDPDGNVALRGDRSVTILVDGQPSGLLSGETRAQAILQLPGDGYERVEIMTNPSAAYTPEGSGGIINLISRKTAVRPGRTTTLGFRAAVGEGRWSIGTNGSWALAPWSVTGELSLRSDPSASDVVRERRLANGEIALNSVRTSTEPQGGIGRISVERGAGSPLRLIGELRGSAFDNTSRTDGVYVIGSTNAFDRTGRSSFESSTWGATLRALRRWEGTGTEWLTEVRRTALDNEINSELTVRPRNSGGLDSLETLQTAQQRDVTSLTTSLNRPWASGARLRTGYEFSREVLGNTNVFGRGGSSQTVIIVPGLTSRIASNQDIHAGYAVFERPLGDKLTLQTGLRFEHALIDAWNLTANVGVTRRSSAFYPTLHVAYQLTEATSVRASYSRRVERAGGAALTPFVTYQDPFNLWSGNPDLKDQFTDAVEASWQRRVGDTFLQATAYLRDTQGAFTPVTRNLGDGVYLTRPENLGRSRDTGIEFVATGALGSRLRYSAAANVLRQTIDVVVPSPGERSGTFVSGRATLNWQPTDRDFVQLSANWQGTTLVAQGRREGGEIVNVGYRRRLTQTLDLNITARDVFDQSGSITVLETEAFRERSEQIGRTRAILFGLSWTPGAARNQTEGFDFSAPN